MEQFGLGPFLHLVARLQWFLGWLASFDSLWWMKLAIALPLVFLVAQLIGGGRKAEERRYWRMYP